MPITRIDLIIDEPLLGRTVPWPLTTGVPFPRGGLTDARHCRLVDDTGQEQPLQARVAATWERERQSIRWLTIDFIAWPGRRYALEFGPEVARAEAASPLRITEGEPLQVVTGALAVEFSRRGAAALGEIRAVLDGEGGPEAGEVVAAGAPDGEHYTLDAHGARCSGAGDGEERVVTVEVAGPVRACVRVDGCYTGPGGERIAAYRTRYHLYAGLGLLRVVDEFRIVGSTRETRWRDIGFALALPPADGARVVTADASAEGTETVAARWQPETAAISSFPATYRHYGNPEYHAAVVAVDPAGEQRLRQTDRAGAWLQVADDRAAVTGSLRWFWQQFPKEWEVTADRMVLHLWSPRGGELDFGPEGVRRFLGEAGYQYLIDRREVLAPRNAIERHFWFGGKPWLDRGEADGQGISKHHEFLFHFAPAERAAEGIEYGRLAAQPPVALASGAWNCGTDVFGPLAARPNASPYEAAVDRIFDLGRAAQEAFGDYGWWVFGSGPHYSFQWDPVARRHYADPRRFEYHTYQKETQLWWCYLRSGERKFYDWALPSENHWVDIAVAHVPLTARTDWIGGEAETATQHWRPGDWSIDGPIHYLRHHGTGEAWLRGGAQFWASYHRTLETTTLAYYLTGDERFQDVLDYWRDYWGGLAGITSASAEVPPWHREQAWFRAAAAGEAPRTWAEMLRDYAPFTSGSRHQLTLFFNLATLYEHTWDARIGQVLAEYAGAFLDPEHPLGVWRCQENRLPARAEAPIMAHYWAPALWKYARATGDPRMPALLARYYDACYGADPFDEDVGNYSAVHLAYAYYYTRDPRHLGPIQRELERLLAHAAPLGDPAELGMRIYNPYAPIATLTAIPRLQWALGTARQAGVPLPPPPALPLQRTALALEKRAGTALTATVWGFDAEPTLLGPDGALYREATVETRPHRARLQPFDRALPEFAAYLHTLTIPAAAPAGGYLLSPRLETALLDAEGAEGVLCNAARPVALLPNARAVVAVPAGVAELCLESAEAAALRVTGPDGEALAARVEDHRALCALPPGVAGKALTIAAPGAGRLWFRIAGWPEEACWVSLAAPVVTAPPRAPTLAALRPALSLDVEATFVPGRFGQALQIVPGRALRFPDHHIVDGRSVTLCDLEQGTLEFWIRRRWDERLAPVDSVPFLSNGIVKATIPWPLPVDEWAHVALVWRPYPGDASKSLLHIYLDGLDRANYRSFRWEGYRPGWYTQPRTGASWGEFVSRAAAGAPFALDELRLSCVPRYVDREVRFGGRQTFNPYRFTPPDHPLPADADTLLLFRFDGDLEDAVSGVVGQLSEDGDEA
jgi:PcRGLX-like protein central beta sandwich domain/PcRGLX-like N-terminal RIFT barrel domain